MSDRGYVRRRCRQCGVAMGSSDTNCSKGHKVGREGGWGYVLDITPPGGKRKRLTKGGFQTKGAAQAALSQVEHDQATGQLVEPSTMATGDYLTLWLKAVRVRESSRSAMEVVVRRHLLPTLGDVPLQSLTRPQVKEAYANMRILSGDRPSKNTMHSIHATLHKALGDAVTDGLLRSNPADKAMSAPKAADSEEMQVWTESQVRDFLNHVRGDDFYCFFRTLLFTGARRGELAGLHWDDLDLVAGTLTISRQRSKQGKDGVKEGPPKTGRGRRTIDIDPATVEALVEHSAKQGVARLDAGPAWQDHGYVFCKADGRPPHPDAFTYAWQSRIAASGLSLIRLHDARHTHATLLLKAGVPAHVVSQRLGHSSVAFTLTQYAHVIPGQQQDAVMRLAALIDGENPSVGVGSASVADLVARRELRRQG